MCRNIRQLSNLDPPATEHEITDAALQYVRKIAGTRAPSRVNQEAFAAAISDVSEATRTLLTALYTTVPPRDREVEAAKAKTRAAARYARQAS